MSDDDSKPVGSGRPDWSAVITTTGATLAVVGLVAQAFCYVIARGYLKPYNVEPTDVGITPLNAALRMTTTTGMAGGILAALISIPFLVIGYKTNRTTVKILRDADRDKLSASEVTRLIQPGGQSEPLRKEVGLAISR